MTPIEVRPLFEVVNGRRIVETIAGGQIANGFNKDGSPRVETYAAGSLALTDKTGRVIVGPIDPRGAYNLALDVVNGDPKAITEPKALHVLAVSVLASLGVGPMALGSARLAGSVETASLAEEENPPKENFDEAHQ